MLYISFELLHILKLCSILERKKVLQITQYYNIYLVIFMIAQIMRMDRHALFSMQKHFCPLPLAANFVNMVG